jgi:predicted component of type VI protein secretion system
VSRVRPDAQPASPGEREARLAVESRGDPYLLWRDGAGKQHVFALTPEWDRATIGRALTADICVSWDEEVSRVHAQLEHLGDDWALADDGLSRNGSFVNEEPVPSRRRLHDGDELRFGDTVMVFRAPFQVHGDTVVSAPRGGG